MLNELQKGYNDSNTLTGQHFKHTRLGKIKKSFSLLHVESHEHPDKSESLLTCFMCWKKVQGQENMTAVRKIRNRFVPRQHNKPTKLNYRAVSVC